MNAVKRTLLACLLSSIDNVKSIAIQAQQAHRISMRQQLKIQLEMGVSLPSGPIGRTQGERQRANNPFADISNIRPTCYQAPSPPPNGPPRYRFGGAV
jgi:hypothetical protein